LPKRIKIFISLILFIIYTLALAAGPLAAKGPDKNLPEHGRAVIVVIDKISWGDFEKANIPALKKLASEGAVGLMTTNPAGGSPRISQNTYTTIGAGAKVQGSQSGGMAFHSTEKYENDTAGVEYYRRTGLHAGDRQVVHLGIGETKKVNLSLKYSYSIGAIGTVLHQNELKTAVIGNADMPGYPQREQRYHREAVNIAMDNSGIVDYGSISSNSYLPDPRSLAGVKTDYRALLNEFNYLSQKANLIVIETGDTSRIEEMTHLTSDGVGSDEKLKALAEVDTFIGQLVNIIDLKKDLLMVVAPGPSNEAMEQGDFLTPFIMAGKDISKGLVWSGTIKRNGLIANIDVASKILGYFTLPQVVKGDGTEKDISLGGQVIESRNSADPMGKISKLGRNAVFLYNARYPFVKSYINSELIVLIIFLGAVIWRKKIGRYLTPLFLGFTTVPGIMLWVNLFPRPSLGILGIEVIGAAAVITLGALFIGRKRPLTPFLITSGLTALLIVIDIFIGAPLAKTSPFSYDVMSGARFYGIGNEYAGVLIGCTVVFAGLLMDMFKHSLKIIKVINLIMFLTVIYTIAAPNLGTEVGGTIAAAAGFGITGLIMYGGSINRRAVITITVSVVAVLTCFIAYDLTRAVEAQSHIGRTITLISSGGPDEIGNIITRKWIVNWRLITGTTWSWYYFISVLAVPLLGRRFPSECTRFKENYPWFNKFLTGVFVSSIFTLLLNDSGIVSAAMMITYAIWPFLTGIIASCQLTVDS